MGDHYWSIEHFQYNHVYSRVANLTLSIDVQGKTFTIMDVSSINAKLMLAFLTLMMISLAADGQPSLGMNPRKPHRPCTTTQQCIFRYGWGWFCRGGSCERRPDVNVTMRNSSIARDSNSLLIGSPISQGSSKNDLVGAARTKGASLNEIDEVKGREVAESSRQHVDPQDELEMGRKIKEYQQNPQDAQVRMDIGGSGRMMSGPIPRARGKVLDDNVQTGIYVPNPIKVLGEIKARGGDIETFQGEVVAGNAVDIDVVSIKESEIQSRNICGAIICPKGTICRKWSCRSVCDVMRCPMGTQCCAISESCESSCPNGRQQCSDGQIYCSHLSKCTLPQECRI